MSIEKVLRNSVDDEFFKCLENHVNFKIPPVIKNILSVTQYTSAYAFRNFDKTSLNKIETFMRNDFSVDMVDGGMSTKDFLGFYWKSQDQFKLVGGQIVIIENIARECQKLNGTQNMNEGRFLYDNMFFMLL